MTVMQAGSAAHRAAVAELEQGLGPFDHPSWRADLALLTGSARQASVQWALDAQTVVRLAQAVPRSPGDERGGTPWTSFVREIALAGRLSDVAAHKEVALSLALVGRHPVTLHLLGQGDAPLHRARALVEECLPRTDAVVAEVERVLARQLDSLTPTRLRQEVARIALRLDADAAARAEATASAGRTVRKRGLVDAQAEIVLTGPAAAVQQWWDALTDRARALKAAGDPRGLGALRFDLAVSTDPRAVDGTGPLLSALGVTPAPAGAGPDQGSWSTDARCSRPVQARIDVPAATALGLGDEPGWLEGHGWISAPLSRQLLTVAELVKACVDPATGQLLDLAERPMRPRLDARALREALSRIVVTPHELRETVAETQPQHDPSPALEAFVQVRDRFCDGPTGTQVPARRTDTDHDRPWPTGPTSAANLISRSRRTHQLKHVGWTATRTARGTWWTSPAGQSVFAPAHRHPPDSIAPHARPPDPDVLAARDRALTRTPAWADLDLDVDVDGEPRAAPSPASVGSAAHGWPDEPGF